MHLYDTREDIGWAEWASDESAGPIRNPAFNCRGIQLSLISVELAQAFLKSLPPFVGDRSNQLGETKNEGKNLP